MDGDAPEVEVAMEDITDLNEQLINKLRLLNYEKDYVHKGGNKAINNASFTYSTNPTEQFNTFKK